MIEKFLLPELCRKRVLNRIWFQQDGATCHTIAQQENIGGSVWWPTHFTWYLVPVDASLHGSNAVQFFSAVVVEK